jgi:hypothetical protein
MKNFKSLLSAVLVVFVAQVSFAAEKSFVEKREIVRTKIEKTYSKIENMSDSQWADTMGALAKAYKEQGKTSMALAFDKMSDAQGKARVLASTRSKLNEQSLNGVVGIIWILCEEAGSCEDHTQYPLNFWIFTIITLEGGQAENI